MLSSRLLRAAATTARIGLPGRTRVCATIVQSRSCTSSPAHTEPNTTAAPASLSSDPLSHSDFFGVQKLFTVEDLFKARVHLGHTPRALNQRMRPFVFGSRFDTSIIDLDQTAVLLRRALNFLAHITANGGIVLFVCRQPHLVHLVERTAVDCGEYAHCRKWSTTILSAPKTTFKQEVRLPDVIILLHSRDGTKYDEHLAVADAAKMSIPTIGIMDTDCDPNMVTFPIPGNDDTMESSQLYLHLFKQAILLGKKHRAETTEAIQS